MEKRKASVGPLFRWMLASSHPPNTPRNAVEKWTPLVALSSCFSQEFLFSLQYESSGLRKNQWMCGLAQGPWTFIHFPFSFWPADHPLWLQTYISLGRNWFKSWIIQNASWILENKNYFVAIQLLLFSPNWIENKT